MSSRGQTTEDDEYDVFVSFGGELDAAVAASLTRRLKRRGLRVFDYRGEMKPGGEILTQVMDAMRASRTAILIYSEDSKSREWVITEWTLALEHKRRKGMGVFPVRVGPATSAPVFVTKHGLSVHAVADDRRRLIENNVTELIKEVFDAIGGRVPLLLPTCVVALDDKRWERVVQRIQDEGFANVIAHLGLPTTAAEILDGLHQEGYRHPLDGESSVEQIFMTLLNEALPGDPKRLEPLLRARHGTGPDQLQPFVGTKQLKEVIEDAVGRFNRARSDNRPIVLPSWVDPDTLLRKGNQHLRAEWQNSPRLLVVDTVAMIDKSTYEKVPRLIGLDIERPERLILVCLPPFTRGTDLAVRLAGHMFNVSLESSFRRWKDIDPQKTRSSFDIPSSFGLERWLVNALTSTVSEFESPLGRKDANQKRTDDVGRRFGGGPNPGFGER